MSSLLKINGPLRMEDPPLYTLFIDGGGESPPFWMRTEELLVVYGEEFP